MEKTDCLECPLRKLKVYIDFSPSELAFMRSFKVSETVVPTGSIVLSQGESSQMLYTVLEGFGTRSVLLEDGRRQVLNFVFPGDLIGLQSALMGEMQHTVQASTPMRLCQFRRNRLWEMFRDHPDRAFDLTWISAVEEHFLGETIATLGQRDGQQRTAWALARIWLRLSALGLREENRVPLPYRQAELADALGMSVVHTNRTLVALRKAGLVSWSRKQLCVLDEAGLLAQANMTATSELQRPLI